MNEHVKTLRDHAEGLPVDSEVVLQVDPTKDEGGKPFPLEPKPA